MRIGVNTRLLLPNKMEGIGWFANETLKRITLAHPEHEFHFFFDRLFDNKFIFSENIIPHVVHPPARHPILFKIWFNKSIKRALRKHRCDVFLSPDGYMSLRSDVPSLAVIHDLNFEHYPEDLPRYVLNYYKKYFPQFAEHASRIATVSEASKKDIIETYSVDPDKIDVVYNGVREDFFVEVSKSVIQKTKETFAKGSDYFLFVGALHPRKNITRLISAFGEFRRRSQADVKLLIVGESYWMRDDMKEAYSHSEFKEDIIFKGHLNKNLLAQVYASALALTFVPYFEGFGVPILEGFASGIPVITSNCSSMPEVAGGAAYLVDPFSVDSIASGMEYIYRRPDERTRFIEAGKKRVQDFSWDRTAEALWKSLEMILPE